MATNEAIDFNLAAGALEVAPSRFTTPFEL